MGDLVLLGKEVPAVMSKLFSGGFDVTAVHNHVNELSSHVMYMHAVAANGRLTTPGASKNPLAQHRAPALGSPAP